MSPTRIRLAAPDDAPAVRAIYGPIVRDTAISFELEPPVEAEMRRRIELTLARSPFLVCELPEGIAGYAYAGEFRARAAYAWTAEASVYVGASHRRRGVGRALGEALLACLRLQGYCAAIGVVALPNPASEALMRTLGLVEAGVLRAAGYKLGRWHDVSLWQVILTEHAGPPHPPLPLERAAAGSAWAEALERAASGVRS